MGGCGRQAITFEAEFEVEVEVVIDLEIGIMAAGGTDRIVGGVVGNGSGGCITNVLIADNVCLILDSDPEAISRAPEPWKFIKSPITEEISNNNKVPCDTPTHSWDWLVLLNVQQQPFRFPKER